MAILLFVLILSFGGACLGSAACVFYRRVLSPAARPQAFHFFEPKSRCMYCRMPIPWYLNVPIYGWVSLQGKARCCGNPIGTTELRFEVAGAVIGFGVGLWSLHAVFHLI